MADLRDEQGEWVQHYMRQTDHGGATRFEREPETDWILVVLKRFVPLAGARGGQLEVGENIFCTWF